MLVTADRRIRLWLELRPYSPVLAPSDFHLFGLLKDALRGCRFASDMDVRVAVQKWLHDLQKPFYQEGIRKCLVRWTKCIAQGRDYQKINASVVHISLFNKVVKRKV
ncbi:putative transposase [Nephila pilipes]|uniref:Putative transposase n=1 Tax=Nephila pilipes TaxID=299642 RepID=A0A8X6MYN3_NEPPI|nr:putative transposase [Nephila pilipes]